jgi:PAS domain S-box-containing protein
MSYDLAVLEISRPLDETIISQLPIGLIVFRASDQVIVYANQMALQLSGYSTSDMGTLSIWDLLVEEDSWHAVVEAQKPLDKQSTNDGDQSEGFARLRSKSGRVSTFWFTIKDIEDVDGFVRFRQVIAFLDYDQQSQNGNWHEYLDEKTNQSFRRSAGMFASELNNALSILQIALEANGLLPVNESLKNALAPIKSIGERWNHFAFKGEATSDQYSADAGITNNIPPSSASIDRSETRVLLVDDDLQLLEVLRDLLRMHGFIVKTAISSQSALDVAQSFSLDVALIDLRLGEDDGRDTAKILSHSFPTIRIIFMSGYAESLLAIEHAGIYKVLKKPFAIDSLIALIGNKVDV